jgi:hypothetical protein
MAASAWGAATISDPGGTAGLAGFAYFDTNDDGTMDAGDFVIGGAKMTLTLFDGTSLVTYSQPDGSYSFSNLLAGTYSISMVTPVTLPGQDSGAWRTIAGSNGTTVSIGTQGTVSQNAYRCVALSNGQQGTNFNFAEDVYLIAVVSKRLLLSSSPDILADQIAPALATTPSSNSMLSFGPVLVGTTGTTTLNATNVGGANSSLAGTFPSAEGTFDTAGAPTFGSLGTGQTASQQYTYMPVSSGTDTQAVTVVSNGGS